MMWVFAVTMLFCHIRVLILLHMTSGSQTTNQSQFTDLRINGVRHQLGLRNNPRSRL